MINRPISILIVEDEFIIAENINEILLELGYEEIHVCNSYTEAIKSLNQNQYDLAILDINLGKGVQIESGFSIAQKIKDNHQLPFIFLTAYNDKNIIIQATQYNPSGYLIKPIKKITLFGTIQTSIENHLSNKSPLQIDEPQECAYLYIKNTKGVLTKVFWKDVTKLESVKNYVRILTQSNETHLFRGSLKQMLTEIIPYSQKEAFYKVSRSVAVNIHSIDSIDDNTIVVGNEKWSLQTAQINKLIMLLDK